MDADSEEGAGQRAVATGREPGNDREPQARGGIEGSRAQPIGVRVSDTWRGSLGATWGGGPIPRHVAV